MLVHWVERWTGRRWQGEDGWETRAQAEKAARFYRRTYHQRTRITEVWVS